jgi:Rrf2 family iron-sulfur cluster assembly transcriptional regulator
MLGLSKKMVFALEAVLDIAYNAGAEPVRSKEITGRQGIPQRYIEQVMQRLVRAGILNGVRGPRGGYRLARERRRVTVGEIARIVYALEDRGPAVAHENGSDLARAVVRPLWLELQDEQMARLDAITIDALCERARASGVPSALRERLDFTI